MRDLAIEPTHGAALVPGVADTSVRAALYALPTPLVGRDRELDLLRAYLRDDWIRLITVTGCPGVGKTALALHAAASLLGLFRGVAFVALTEVDGRRGAHALAEAAEHEGSGDSQTSPNPLFLDTQPPRESRLVILDGADLIAGAAVLIDRFLAARPGTKLLVTRRAPLRLRREYQVPLAPLAVPERPASGDEVDLRRIARSPAVALFTRRAAAIQPSFAVTSANAAAVAALCRRLDGLPLALELAAARVRTLPPPALLDRIAGGAERSPLQLLAGGFDDLPAHHQSLRAAIGAAYDGLSADEQALLERLSEFEDDWSLDDLDALCPPALPALCKPARILESLVEQGLVRRISDAHPPRFRTLYVVRDYARERVAAAQKGTTALNVTSASPPPRLLPPPASAVHSAADTTAALARLSPREAQVLALVAAGRSNRQIAGELSLSERTVAHHLTSIFNKLGVTSRTAAAAMLHQRLTP